MIGVVDYGCGNLFSLAQALKHLQFDFILSDNKEKLRNTDQLILPGVGAFGEAAKQLKQRKLFDFLQTEATQGKPLLGICVGMQLLFDQSNEFGCHQGLGLIPGTVKSLPAGEQRIPNIGWHTFQGITTYFVHSYAVQTNKNHVKASIEFNAQQIPAIVQQRNIVGFQFHPEKSGQQGLELLAKQLGS